MNLASALPSTPLSSGGIPLPDEVDEYGASEIVGLSVRTLRAYRSRRVELPFYRRGGRVRYRVSDLLEWIEAGRVEPEPRA
jgi:hypothetical protein